MALDPATFAAERVLRDGGSIHLRVIRADDKTRLADHFSRLGAQSVYFRFFRAKRRLTDEELRQFTELDFRRHVGLVATLRRAGEEEIVGVGRYALVDTLPGDPLRAEVAFAVADAHQRRGIGTVLLDTLAEIARQHGVTRFSADVLADNHTMLSVFRKAGYALTSNISYGVTHLEFPILHNDARPPVAETDLPQ